MTFDQPLLTAERLTSALTYAQYRAVVDRALAEGRATSLAGLPADQMPMLVHYTQLNVHRMERLDRTTALTPDLLAALQALTRPLAWVVLTEGWCGDAAQILPVLHHVAEASKGRISLRLFLRDQHPDLMAAYLTNGSRSIPKLACFDATMGRELGTWGPRPAGAQAVMDAHRDLPHDQQVEHVHAWYAKDRTQQVQAEVTARLRAWQDA